MARTRTQDGTEHSEAHHGHWRDHSMGCAALGPSYKWLFLSFSGHSEDKSLMLKVFWFRGSGRNSSITAAEQRNISDMFLPSDGSIRGLVLYLFSSPPKSRAGAAQ